MAKNKEQQSWYRRLFSGNDLLQGLLVILLILLIIFLGWQVRFIFEPVRALFTAVGAPILIAGTNDSDIILAADTLREIGGGQVVVNNGKITTLPLAIGGLMSDQSFQDTIATNNKLQQAFSEISDIKYDPFLTLSFMALPVIPSLKITDQGLFDFNSFSFIQVQD